MERRGGRALLVVDVGVPRNIDPGAGEVFGVTLLDIDDLRALRRAVARAAAPGDRARARDHRRGARPPPHRAHRRARSRRSSPRCAPTSTTLRLAELERHRAKLDALDPAARDAVEQLTRSIVNKLLHEPTVRVKDAAGSARGELYADALVELFGLARRRRSRPLMPRPLRVATRGSELARWQAHRVATLLGADTELVSWYRRPATSAPTSRSTRSAAPASS